MDSHVNSKCKVLLLLYDHLTSQFAYLLIGSLNDGKCVKDSDEECTGTGPICERPQDLCMENVPICNPTNSEWTCVLQPVVCQQDSFFCTYYLAFNTVDQEKLLLTVTPCLSGDDADGKCKECGQEPKPDCEPTPNCTKNIATCEIDEWTCKKIPVVCEGDSFYCESSP